MVRMLENNSHRTGGNAYSAIGAFILINNVGAGSHAADSILRTDLGAFAALRANKGTVLSRVRELRFYSKGRLFWVDFLKMFDGADLETKAASRAFVPVDFDPHF
jgi:hypothetical protein